MACSCQGGTAGEYEVVTGEGTVPAQIGGVSNSFATQAAATTALRTAGTGGYVRTRQTTRV